ncbi:efflux RND transporter periplasmic adaptor subunit [Patescibacteria group bacterium]|nr:efflux RND transporter periplasmic adaptor subunit [Patescibacteria group bacterium]
MADKSTRTEKEVRKIERELARDEKELKRLRLSVRGLTALVLIGLAIAGAIFAYLTVTNRSVYIDKSDIEAPEIDLSASAPGVLNDMFVKAGDKVAADQVVARVGDQLIKTKVAGIVTKADAAVGQSYNAGQTVVAMIDPSQLRAVGHIDENKGLDRIHVGQYATFTVDAFGSKQYSGIVDEVSPEAQSGDVVFNISDKRQEQVFDVKVRYDTSLYPELKDGMSARIWVQAQ